MGKVPAVLREDGKVITESGAILYHFSQGTQVCGPRRLDSRTDVLRWMFFEQYNHEPALAVMRYLMLHYAAIPAHVPAENSSPGSRHALRRSRATP